MVKSIVFVPFGNGSGPPCASLLNSLAKALVHICDREVVSNCL